MVVRVVEFLCIPVIKKSLVFVSILDIDFLIVAAVWQFWIGIIFIFLEFVGACVLNVLE